MDSTVVIFIIAINILDCNGVSLADQLERILHNTKLQDDDDFKISRRSPDADEDDDTFQVYRRKLVYDDIPDKYPKSRRRLDDDDDDDDDEEYLSNKISVHDVEDSDEYIFRRSYDNGESEYPNKYQILRRLYDFHPGLGSTILGSPSLPSHLPEAEPILPGHTLIRPALGMLKSAVKYPHKDMDDGAGVYGNIDNLGITYDGTGERVLYTGFRRSNGDSQRPEPRYVIALIRPRRESMRTRIEDWEDQSSNQDMTDVIENEESMQKIMDKPIARAIIDYHKLELEKKQRKETMMNTPYLNIGKEHDGITNPETGKTRFTVNGVVIEFVDSSHLLNRVKNSRVTKKIEKEPVKIRRPLVRYPPKTDGRSGQPNWNYDQIFQNTPLKQRYRPIIKRPRKRRYPRKKMAAYAYVDLENLNEVIKEYRRQRANPINMVVNQKKKKPVVDEEPEIPSDFDTEIKRRPPVIQNDPKLTWFLNSPNSYNHIKIDADAPDWTELMPEVVLADNDDNMKWWFYHQSDFNPFRD